MKKVFLLAFALFITVILFYRQEIYAFNHIYRISASDVEKALGDNDSACSELPECNLQPGDILIRRYITSSTWLFNALANPNFTHAAIFLGDDKIIEAVGNNPDPQNDVVEYSLSQSDWFDSGIEMWVIIRPDYGTSFKMIKTDLQQIAQDPEYSFGISNGFNKKMTCADLIYRSLRTYNIINENVSADVISPDHLFSMAMHKENRLQLVAWSSGKTRGLRR